MAITFVDSWYSGHMNSTDDSITMTIPAGAQADDIMIAYCHESNNADQEFWDDDGGGGNGWTQLAYHRTTGGRDLETAIYYKVHSGSESNPTFTFGVNQPMAGSMVVYRGCDIYVAPKLEYSNAQNNGAPPNPGIEITSDNCTVLCFHSQTHDDVTESAPPTGFTLRVDGWLNSTADHMNHYVADISNIDTQTLYTPPDWQHTVANTTPEYHTYTLVLTEPFPLGILSNFIIQKYSDTNLVIDGYGFKASQGSGKVEIWSDESGTIKTVQSIDSWSDDTIQIDLVQGSLPNNDYVYLVVTNDDSDESVPEKFFIGIEPFYVFMEGLKPDIYHRFDGDFVDVMENGTLEVGDTTGSWTFPSTPLTKSSEKSWSPSTIDTIMEMGNTEFTNDTGNRTIRLIGGWIQVDKVYNTPSCFWEEGGGVNNFYIALGFGNTLLFNGRDDGQWAAQSYSDFKITPGRAYHVMCRFEGSGYGNLFTGYVNGKRVQQDVGEQPNIATMVGHSGGWCYNKPDKNLDTGGTDIVYKGLENSFFQDWATFSDIGLEDTPMSDATIRSIFVMGCLAEDVLLEDTQSNIQTTLDAISPFDYEDVPCGLEIYPCTDNGGDLTLDLDDVTFDERVDIHVKWLGESGQTLTIIGFGTTNIDENMCESPMGGTMIIMMPKSISISGAFNGSKIVILDSSDDSFVDSIESSSGTFVFNTFIDNIDIIIIHDDYRVVRKLDYMIVDGDVIPIIQEDDYTYSNPI